MYRITRGELFTSQIYIIKIQHLLQERYEIYMSLYTLKIIYDNVFGDIQ